MAPPSSGGLEAKHFILATLVATLVAAAVVTVVSVVLSPARISFSVTEASNDFTSHPARLLLTLAAHNPSRHAAVRYQSIFVDVSNSSGPLWVNWMRAHAHVSARLPLDQARHNDTTEVNATVSMVGLAVAEQFTGHRTSRNFSVMVTAIVQFKVGVAWTRLYDIKVNCGNVDFFANESRTTDCHAA